MCGPRLHNIQTLPSLRLTYFLHSRKWPSSISFLLFRDVPPNGRHFLPKIFSGLHFFFLVTVLFLRFFSQISILLLRHPFLLNLCVFRKLHRFSIPVLLQTEYLVGRSFRVHPPDITPVKANLIFLAAGAIFSTMPNNF